MSQSNGNTLCSSSTQLITPINARKTPTDFQRKIIEESLVKVHKLKSVILSLSVGTGKTGISLLIAYQRALQLDLPILVVVSKSILSQWSGEIQAFLPGCSTTIFHPEYTKDCMTSLMPLHSTFDKKEAENETVKVYLITPEILGRMYSKYAERLELHTDGLVVTNSYSNSERIYRKRVILYGASGNNADVGPLFSTMFAGIIVDEAQTMLNPTTNKVKGLLCIMRDWTIVLSASLLSEAKEQNLFGLSMMCAKSFAKSQCDYYSNLEFSKFLEGRNSYKLTKILNAISVTREKNEDHLFESMEQNVKTEIISFSMSEKELMFFKLLRDAVIKLHRKVEDMRRRILLIEERKYGEFIIPPAQKARRKKMKLSLADMVETETLKHDARIIRGLLLSMITMMRLSVCCISVVITSLMLTLSDLSTSSVMFKIVQHDILEPMMKSSVEFDNVNLLSDGKQSADEFPDGVNDKGLLDEDRGVISSRIREAHRLLLKHKNEQVVIFSTFRMMIDMMQHFFPMMDSNSLCGDDKSYLRQYFTVHGGDSMNKRKTVLTKFSESQNGVLLLTYQTGSLGINLHSASIGIIFDQPWNSDEVYQSIGRIHRRGNKNKNLYFYKLFSNTALESGIMNLHYAKHQLSSVVSTDSSFYDVVKSKRPTLNISKIIKVIKQETVIATLEEIESGRSKVINLEQLKKSKHILKKSTRISSSSSIDDDKDFDLNEKDEEESSCSSGSAASFSNDDMNTEMPFSPFFDDIEVHTPDYMEVEDSGVQLVAIYNKFGERIQ